MKDFKTQKKFDSFGLYKDKRLITSFPSYTYKQQSKKCYWWHILFIIIGCIALTEFMLIVFNYSAKTHSFRIDLRQYPKINYHHIEQTPFPSTTWPNQTNVYHVTKEFGPATLGGLGVLLTAMTKEQQRSGFINTNVILPYYSFLKARRKTDEIKKIADLVIYVKDINNDDDKKKSSSEPSSASYYSKNQRPFTKLSSSSSSMIWSSSFRASSQSSSLSSSSSASSSSASPSSYQYSYLNENEENNWVPVEFSVSRWKYIIHQPPPIKNYVTWYIDDEGKNKTLKAKKRRPALKHEYIYVYLIGPGKQAPLNKVFKVDDATQIYNTNKSLPTEWRDQYFLKATATFLSYQASTTRHDQSLFAPTNDFISPSSGVDVIHIHGAVNAYLSHYLKDPTLWNSALPQPAIVYTLHDYFDELRYSISLQSIQSFDSNPPLFPPTSAIKTTNNIHSSHQYHEQLSSYNNYTFYQDKLHTSSLGIELADMVTFVSKSMVMDMVEGQVDFHLKELTMNNILRKIEKKQFFGISNGVNYQHVHPFKNKKLLRAKIAYPEYAWQQLIYDHHHPSSSSSSIIPYTLSNDINHDHVASHKKRAKRWLIRNQFLAKEDEHRPLVLFIGRFQYNKGLASFERAIQAFIKHDMKLILFGSPHDYPLEKILLWQKKYPNHVMVHTTEEEQQQWMIYCRAAADFAFVPSVTESFGLVAAEGLIFGTPVISTGVGGLGEFLNDRPLPLSSSSSSSSLKREKKENKVDNADNEVVHDDDDDDDDNNLENNNKNKNDSSSKKKIMITAKNFMKNPYNAYLYQLDKSKDHDQSLEMAIQQAAQDYYYLRKHRLEREQFLLHVIDTALALGWQTPHHEVTGPLFDYFRVYDLAIQYQYNQSNAMTNKNPNLF